MKPFSAGLDALLAGWGPQSTIAMADLYTFTLAGGEMIRLSGAQTAISTALFAATSVNYGAICTFALGPRLARTKTRTDIGVQVGELDIEIYAGADDLVGTLTWQHAVRLGLFDGAGLELDRAFMQPYGTRHDARYGSYGVADPESQDCRVCFRAQACCGHSGGADLAWHAVPSHGADQGCRR